jgi:hypothetical protein
MKRYSWAVIGLLALTIGCAESPDEKAKRQASEIAIKAVARNIPLGERIEIAELRTYPGRYGAVCGSGKLGREAGERFWVGGTNTPGEGSPILERWEPSKAANEALFASYCKGMVTIPRSLYSAVAEGSETEADRNRGAAALPAALSEGAP